MRAKGFAHRELALAWGVLTHNLWMLARMSKTKTIHRIIKAQFQKLLHDNTGVADFARRGIIILTELALRHAVVHLCLLLLPQLQSVRR